jgi:hypothetical protein
MKLRWLITGPHFSKRELQCDIPNWGWVTVPEVQEQSEDDLELEAELAAIAQGIE